MTYFKSVRLSDNVIVASFSDSVPYIGPINISDSGLYITLTVPDGVDPNGVFVVVDGGGNRSLVFDQTYLDNWQRQQNKIALDSFTATRSAQAESDIAAALAAGTGEIADDTTHLMIIAVAQDIIANPDAWTQSLSGNVQNGSDTVSNLPQTSTIEVGSYISGPNIPGSTTVSEILTSTSIKISANATGDGAAQVMNFDPTPVAMADLAAYRPVFFQIQAIRGQRDSDIASFVPPYPSVSPLYP